MTLFGLEAVLSELIPLVGFTVKNFLDLGAVSRIPSHSAARSHH